MTSREIPSNFDVKNSKDPQAPEGGMPEDHIKAVQLKIEELRQEMDYVEPHEVLPMQREIEQMQTELVRLQNKQPPKKEQGSRQTADDRVDTVRNPFHNTELDSLPEPVQAKLKNYVTLLKDAHIPGWELRHISVNLKEGASVYGYYWKDGSRVKVRLSDHVGRWSGQDLDLRNPKSADSITKFFRSKDLKR